MKAGRTLIAIAVALAFSPAAARATSFGSVGMVEAIRGATSDDEVKVERPGEGRRVIGPHDPLYNGDHLVIRGGATACVNVGGVRSCWTNRSANTTVMSRGAGPASILDAAFFRALGLGPPAPGMGIVTGTVLRSAKPVTDGPVSPIGLLAADRQYVTPTTRLVVVAWRGPAQSLTLTPEAGPATSLSASTRPFAEVAIPAGSPSMRIRLEPSEVAWTITSATDAPVQPWYYGRQPEAPQERLARAAWIIVEGPPTWRMFALGELAELSRAEVADAPELYDAALKGRLQRLAASAAAP